MKRAFVVLTRQLIQNASCSIEVPNNATPQEAYALAQKKYGMVNKKIDVISWRTDEIKPIDPDDWEQAVIFGEQDSEEAEEEA